MKGAFESHAGVDDDPTIVGLEDVAVRKSGREPDAIA
jgi:hypothetical protein